MTRIKGLVSVGLVTLAVVPGLLSLSAAAESAAKTFDPLVDAAARLAAPDLVPLSIDRSAVSGDWQALSITGRASVEVLNAGDAPVEVAFEVVFFDDIDRDGDFDWTRDVIFGETTYVTSLAPLARSTVSVPVSGSVRFRDDRLSVKVDAGGAVVEAREGNNVTDASAQCRFVPTVGGFDAALEWEWTGSEIDPLHNQVMMTPLVIDLDGDQTPDIVFMTFDGAQPYQENGRLRAIRGDGSGELFTVTDWRYSVSAGSSPAVADIDGDGRPEIVAVDTSLRRLIAFEHDGTFKWRTADLAERTRIGGPSIADLDGDGRPEIVFGTSVVDSNGSIVWEYDRSGRGGPDPRLPSIVVDLDGDGRPEVVAGPFALHGDGRLLWRFPGADDGYNAVGNFDTDPEPEIVLVRSAKLWVLENDGRVKWGPVPLPPGTESHNHGGPPTVADVDSDGEPEIGVAGGYFYTVFETDGSVKWSHPILDASSHQTGSSVFDFEGDGSAEVIYSDEQVLRIFRGSDGEVLWETTSTSGTLLELPVIADVDGDGNAEIVMSSNDHWDRDVPETRGIQVYGHPADGWVPTRPIWNQHAYHITNVNIDGTIPAVERPSWIEHNTYRMNLPEGGRVFAAPDLSASRIVFDTAEWPDAVTISARIGNGGAIVAPKGTPIQFYAGEPGTGGVLIDEIGLATPLRPGEYLDVEVWWAPSPGIPTDVHVLADARVGGGIVNECDESNNRHAAPFTPPGLVPPTSSPPPTTDPPPTTSAPSTPTGSGKGRMSVFLPTAFR